MVTHSIPNYQRTWELTPYELQRKPQPLLPDSTIVEVSPKLIQSELTCPICLDILKHTMTTKECLHRFCNECITTALRSGNKECPSCRKKLVSKRSLRADLNFDALINRLYPNRADVDKFQENVLSNQYTDGVMASNIKGRRGRKFAATESLDTSELPQSEGGETSAKCTRYDNSNQCDFELVCEPHPDQSGLVRHLKAQRHITVRHLASYLHIREDVLVNGNQQIGRFPAAVELAEDRYHIYAKDHNSENIYLRLPSEMNLSHVASRYVNTEDTQGDSTLILYYRKIDQFN